MSIALVCLVAVAACTHPKPPNPGGSTTTSPPVTRPPTTTPAPAPLFRYTASGGLCPTEGCGRALTIARDGRWVGSDGPRASQGQLDAATLKSLVAEIEAGLPTLADLKPAPELCPSAYDGADITFTFGVGAKPVVATNCNQADHKLNKDVPGNNALLLSMQRLVTKLLADGAVPKYLVEYHEKGGHCRDICPEVSVTIARDGGWFAMNGDSGYHGTLDAATLNQLVSRIASEVVSGTIDRLPPGSCPSFYDGRDITITYGFAGHVITADNCRQNFGENELIAYTVEFVRGLVRDA